MCYGIQVIPKDCWLCKLCASQHNEIPCSLCSNKGGAMKKIRYSNVNPNECCITDRAGSGWAHLSCAQWIPEVKIGNADKMEPITNIESIPSSRWNLLCCICNQRRSVCIQCSVSHYY
jgi:protein Jade-1